MFSLIRMGTGRTVLAEEGPALVLALAVSEAFFRFHSFLLEGVAFLALWYALGAAAWAVRGRAKAAKE